MNVEPIIAALALPPETRVQQRVPKKMLLENGATTPGDKRKIQDGIEELLWVAALKPVNTAVPAYRDAEREYLEIAVLVLTLRPEAKGPRLAELIHRAIPYPVLLISTMGAVVQISLAHKRWSEAEKGRMVVDAVLSTQPFSPTAPDPQEAAFVASLAVTGLPRQDLFALYQGWHDRLAALEAAAIKGAFATPAASEKAQALREALDTHAELATEIANLRAQASRETQLSRRVEMNVHLKQLESKLAELAAKL